MSPFFLWIAMNFTEAPHLFYLKVGGILCGFGDIAALWFLLKVAEVMHGKKPKKRFAILAFFLLINPIQAIPGNSGMFFVVQFLVLGIPYLILAYTAVTEAPAIVAYIKKRATTRTRT
ncbi:hypothetical protein LJC31_07260 [Synergistaceae bacterium OttesenSCG-928-I11]|nr:hypothetical protein [Synergistaceae bacterium OttesenSCG-928-I11]